MRVVGADCGLKPGDLVRVLPNHACVVSNLVDSVWLVNGSGRRRAADCGARPNRVEAGDSVETQSPAG